jgi:TonB family protein
MNITKYTFFIVSIFVALSSAFAQSDHRGIQLYEEGKYAEAVSLLDSASKSSANKSNSRIWNFLGLAYIEVNQPKKAVKSLEKAVKLNGSNSAYRTNLAYAYILNRQQNKARSETEKAIEIDPTNVAAYHLRGSGYLWNSRLDSAEKDALKMIEIDPTFPPGYTLHSDVLVARLAKKIGSGAEVRDETAFLTQAVETLETGAKKTIGRKGHQDLLESLDGMRVFLAHSLKDEPVTAPVPAAPEPGVSPFKILSKPQARYTDAARTAGISGRIRMWVLLGADGRIGHILLLSRLGHGLDENATAAARQIKFEPKKVDGKPVPVVVTVEYGFQIY